VSLVQNTLVAVDNGQDVVQLDRTTHKLSKALSAEARKLADTAGKLATKTSPPNGAR
jgi:hypothetical protein